MSAVKSATFHYCGRSHRVGIVTCIYTDESIRPIASNIDFDGDL